MADWDEGFDYDQLDPGIRKVVRFARSLGIDTTDSGDGVTKLAAGWDPGEAMDFPHVWASFDDPHRAVTAASRLRRALRDKGVELQQNGLPGVTIEASFDPVTGISVVMLNGLSDEMLMKAGR